MSAHTPGTWNYSQESIDPEWWIVTLPGGLVIANVNAHAHQEANARLIAAAPELLASLQELSRLSDAIWVKMSPAESEAMQAAWKKAEAAIAKATGAA